uniref:PDZ domain-containing protein n=1 Tax=Leersia perrieri TaxID=77586 RepID=A0A0D9W3F3_9ORYZ
MKRARLSTGGDEEEIAEQAHGDEEENAATSPEHASSSGASSAVSSPLRWPSLPRAVVGETAFGEKMFEPFTNIDSAIVEAQGMLRTRYFAKRDRELKLVSLDDDVPRSCLVDQKLIHCRELATKIVLQTSKVVLGLSSYIDDKLLRKSSGFLIEWDSESKVGTVLTSALLIQSKFPFIDEWSAGDEYAPHAKVCVHLLDKAETTIVADLLRYDKHYNLALFKINTHMDAQIPSFTPNLNYAQEVVVLGRDGQQNLSVDHGTVQYQSPSSLHRHHYMFLRCGIKKFGIGGPIINFDGQVAGMASLPEMGFIPSSIILKCLEIWKSFDYIPRMHFGMKFLAITLLDPARIEKISRKCNIESGLVVTQVSKGSTAEKLGVRNGDIIKSWNGENISTTIEVDVFHIRKDSSVTIKLAVKVSNDFEVITKGTYPVTPKHCTIVNDDVMRNERRGQGIKGTVPMADDDDVVRGEEATRGSAVEEPGDIEARSPL